MTIEEKGVLLDIYEDLAKKHGWPWDSMSRQHYESRKEIPYWVLEMVEKYGKDHPKFPLIANLFNVSSEEPEEPVDCHNRRDWWTAFVHMLDDTKTVLSKEDRKELYQDLHNLIGHRLKRKEY